MRPFRSPSMKKIRFRKNGFDPKFAQPGFENPKQVKARKAELLRILQRGEEQSGLVLAQIADCKPGNRCGSQACPICMRLLRRWFVAEAAQAFMQHHALTRIVR